MILIISTCKEKLHELEFVKPIEETLRKEKIKFITKHYKRLREGDLKKADKIILSGTSLKDNEFIEDIDKFSWVKDFQKPLLGICAGSHIIGLIFGFKIKKKQEIGLKDIEIDKNFLGVKGKRQVYHLHNLKVLPEIWKDKNRDIYAVLFHPEVRNKEMIVNFCNGD